MTYRTKPLEQPQNMYSSVTIKQFALPAYIQEHTTTLMKQKQCLYSYVTIKLSLCTYHSWARFC